MKNAVEQAAAVLVTRRMKGEQGEVLADSYRPRDITQALTIQQEVSRQWCAQTNDSIGAWKCLLPSPDKLIVAPIFTRTIDTVAPVSVWPMAQSARIEPELVFYFAQDLPARAESYSQAEVDAALGRTHMALELILNRYSNPSECSYFDMLADGLVNQGLFVGPQLDNALAAQASEFNIELDYQGHSATLEGKHPNTLPKAPLYWLVEHLRSSGIDIVAGQAAITGSYAGVIDVPFDTQINIEYKGLGKMQVLFSRK